MGAETEDVAEDLSCPFCGEGEVLENELGEELTEYWCLAPDCLANVQFPVGCLEARERWNKRNN